MRRRTLQPGQTLFVQVNAERAAFSNMKPHPVVVEYSLSPHPMIKEAPT